MVLQDFTSNGAYNALINLQIHNVKKFARCGVRTHAPRWEPDLKSGALDRSANLALMNAEWKCHWIAYSHIYNICNIQWLEQ